MILHFLVNSLIPNKHIYQNTVSPEDLTQVFKKKNVLHFVHSP